MSYLILLCTLKYIFIFYHVNIIQMEKFEVEAEAGLKNYSIFLNQQKILKLYLFFSDSYFFWSIIVWLIITIKCLWKK